MSLKCPHGRGAGSWGRPAPPPAGRGHLWVTAGVPTLAGHREHPQLSQVVSLHPHHPASPRWEPWGSEEQ